VDPELDERPLVDQDCDALPGGQLALRMLSLDLLRAAPELDLLAPRAKIFG
jgi:hypothetical protein